MYLLDTNVVSELRRPKPHGGALAGKSDDLMEDAVIAATADVHGLTVVTCNVRDFAPFNVPTLNPFEHR